MKNGKVTEEIDYLDAAQEAKEIIAEAGTALNDDGSFKEARVSVRRKLLPSEVDASDVTYMDAPAKCR